MNKKVLRMKILLPIAALVLIVMASILSLFVSLGTPAWTALLGEIIPTRIRGKILTNVNWFSQLSAIISTILGGIFLSYIEGKVSLGTRACRSSWRKGRS